MLSLALAACAGQFEPQNLVSENPTAVNPVSGSNPAAPAPVPNPVNGGGGNAVRTPALWESARAEGLDWSRHVRREITSSEFLFEKFVPSDAAEFCPEFSELTQEERTDFWVYFISVIASFESGFRPEVSFEESFTDSTGRPVVSRGLLQISFESANGYGCGFTQQAQLHDPLRNLSCGVKIVGHWIQRDQRIAGGSGQGARGAGRYWSIFRPSHRRFREVKGLIRSSALCSR